MLAATPRADSAQYIEATGILIADSDVSHFQAQEPGHRTQTTRARKKMLDGSALRANFTTSDAWLLDLNSPKSRRASEILEASASDVDPYALLFSEWR
jgi:hypothetical protein